MMSDLQRESLKVLADLWNLAPEIRIGQMFAHLGFLGECEIGRGLGYIEDEEMLAILHRHRSELLARLPAADDELKSEIAENTDISRIA